MTHFNKQHAQLLRLCCMVSLLGMLYSIALAQDKPIEPMPSNTALFLPLMNNMPVQDLPFGVQIDGPPVSADLLGKAHLLHARWLRHPLSWRTAQPDQGQPIQWSQFADFEQALLLAQQFNMSVEVYVIDSPSWATINKPYPTSCGAIRTDAFPAFADFMRQVIARYKAAPFNVHNWELGNEVDIDPRLVMPNNGFGCWGDSDDDAFYGGQQYGAMLKAVVPTLRTEDSLLQIWHGSLLLSKPFTTVPTEGRSERFLNGVLDAGGGPYFDVLPFHAYPTYIGKRVDYENQLALPWTPLGGVVVGKARFLRSIMSSYHVDKPLFLNETALLCYTYVAASDAALRQMQAVYAVRTFTRALSEHFMGMTWFALNGPAWRCSGLLNYDTPTTTFNAYQQFTTQVQWTDLHPYSIFYDPAVEAYAFTGKIDDVQVVWARDDTIVPIKIPRKTFISATDMEGHVIEPVFSDDMVIIRVPFEPVYIIVGKS